MLCYFHRRGAEGAERLIPDGIFKAFAPKAEPFYSLPPLKANYKDLTLCVLCDSAVSFSSFFTAEAPQLNTP